MTEQQLRYKTLRSIGYSEDEAKRLCKRRNRTFIEVVVILYYRFRKQLERSEMALQQEFLDNRENRKKIIGR